MITSESITKIAPALAKAWGEIENPKHNKSVEVKTRNGGKYTFDYTDLGGVLDEAKRVFKDNGILIIQNPYTEGIEEGKPVISVETTLLHNSGEWIKSKPLKMHANNAIQDLGGQITYLKRYSLSAMLGISSEKDDDANGMSHNDYQENPVQNAKPITSEQAGNIKVKSMQFAKVRNRSVDEVYRALKINDLTQLSEVQASSIIKQLDIWLEGVKKEGAKQ